MVREALAGAEHDAWLDAAQLAVSELVTNAVLHTGTVIELRILLEPDRLRVEIGDGSPHPPARRDYSTVSGTGRGLHMVAASVDEWGYYDRHPGKVVWFELRAPTAAPHDIDDEGVTLGNGTGPLVAVTMRNVPLLMHAAWQEHASALIREYLLARIEADLDVLDRHAQANDAMALLYAQIPEPNLVDDAEEIMATAVEPSVTAREVRLRVPVDSVSNFDALHVLLEDAIALAETGGLLSPPVQPEVRQLRAWMCRQVLDQADGRPPRPWTAPIGTHAVVPPDTLDAVGVDHPLGELVAAVAASPLALVAANEHGRIVAASRAALEFLGYAVPGDLVGRRLTCLVPERYRQAHVAGMTLHMTNGRAALVGVAVNVPVLCADDSETLARLTVDVSSGEGHHRLFVGRLEPAS